MANSLLQKSLSHYTAQVRTACGLQEAPVVSFLGLWLLLARFGDDLKDPEERERLSAILALPLDTARAIADEMFSTDHPALAAAVQVWSRGPLPHLVTEGGPMPTQAELDQWASDNTRGLIEKFPAQVTEDTLMILASALAIEAAWDDEFRKLQDGTMQLSKPKVHGVMETEAAGLVAFVAPRTRSGVTVLSVTAKPGTSVNAVWLAAEEVVTALTDKVERKSPTEDGHSWTAGSTTFFSMDRVAELVTSRHAAFKANETNDLTNAPGVSCFAGGHLVSCKQAAMADYNEKGFVAAAVTSMMLCRSAMGSQVTVPEIAYDFTEPHAVIAVIDEGPWSGIPLFSSWVAPSI